MDQTVILRDTSDADGTRHLSAALTPAGDLVIEGRDFGDGVERLLCAREYEWIWTVRAPDLPALAAALGVTTDILAALSARFSGDRAAGLKAFLDARDIPHEVWSRTGD